MSDKQNWYLGQIVTEGEMDTIYTDVENAELNMAKEANLGQGPVATALRSGGILSGLGVTKLTVDSVQVTLGAARDSDGKRIALPSTASVSLVNLGDTPEGDTTNAQGDGSLTASSITAGEAWLSLFIAYDTNLSDARVDSLNNTIYFRQTESFHFELLIGTDSAAPATSRPNLADDRVLLADILLDNNGEIRVISTVDAICASSFDFANIGYGLDDTAALNGRRSDWVQLDPDGTNLELWHNAVKTGNPNNKAYFNIREGDPREMVFALAEAFNTPGDSTTVAGSELMGGKETTGSSLSAPGSATALDLSASSSIHTQLEEIKDKINTLLSRGTDTLTGDLTVTQDVTAAAVNVGATDRWWAVETVEPSGGDSLRLQATDHPQGGLNEITFMDESGSVVECLSSYMLRGTSTDMALGDSVKLRAGIGNDIEVAMSRHPSVGPYAWYTDFGPSGSPDIRMQLGANAPSRGLELLNGNYYIASKTVDIVLPFDLALRDTDPAVTEWALATGADNGDVGSNGIVLFQRAAKADDEVCIEFRDFPDGVIINNIDVMWGEGAGSPTRHLRMYAARHRMGQTSLGVLSGNPTTITSLKTVNDYIEFSGSNPSNWVERFTCNASDADRTLIRSTDKLAIGFYSTDAAVQCYVFWVRINCTYDVVNPWPVV